MTEPSSVERTGEYALRGDDLLQESDVRDLMQVYISARSRRMRENGNGGNHGNGGTGGTGRDPGGLRGVEPPTRLSRGA